MATPATGWEEDEGVQEDGDRNAQEGEEKRDGGGEIVREQR